MKISEKRKIFNPIKSSFERLTKLFADIFIPVIPVVVASGLLNAVLTLITEVFQVDINSSILLIMLANCADSAYYFLPILLAISCSKVFGCNSFLSAIPVGFLLYIESSEIFNGFDLYFTDYSYSASVLPPILIVAVYSVIEKRLNHILKPPFTGFLSPFLGIAIIVPLSVLVVGPIGYLTLQQIGIFINGLIEVSAPVTGAVLGGSWVFFVTFGLQWGAVPIMLNNLTELGYDYIRPMLAPCSFAALGVALGILLTTKKKDLKAIATASVVTIAFSGVMEQLVFEVYPNYKKTLISQCVGGTVGGFYMGLFRVKAFHYATPSIPTIPVFFGDTFVHFIIGIFLAFTISLVTMLILKAD